MNKFLLLNFFMLFALSAHSQSDEFIELTIKTGICHNAKEGVLTVRARREILKKFIQNEAPHLDNCNLLLESTDQIIEKGKVAPPPPDGEDKDHVWVKDPGEFMDLYNRSHKGHGKGEICVNSDGEVSFSLGTENGSLTISTNGKFSLSAKSPSGIEHKVEF
jgi:hypothetical protein